MMQLLSSERHMVGLFKDYNELFDHINVIEDLKLSESSPCSTEETWSFVIFTNKRLSYIYYKTLERSFSKIGKAAVDQELDLIEISKGDYYNPLQIPVTSDVNVDELKKNWCQEYCEAHDYMLVDHSMPYIENHSFTNSISAANIANSVNEMNKEKYAQTARY